MKNAVRIMGLMCVVVLLVGVTVAAQEPAKVAGTWEMSYTFSGPQGEQAITNTLTIEQTGGDITGTIKTQRGESPFTGTVKGNDIKFSVTRETPRGTMTTEYVGKVEGDTMKGTFTMGQGERARTVEWTAKKSK
jgi:hypothetical protein